MASHRNGSLPVFCLVAVLSVVFFSVSNRVTRPLFELLDLSARSELRYGALVAAFLLTIILAGESLRRPAAPAQPRMVWGVALLTLLAAGFLIFELRLWLPPLSRDTELLVLLGAGLLAEELIFRGVVQTQAERLAPHSYAPILVSAVLFGLAHLQRSNFTLTQMTLSQAAYAIIFGLALGVLRTETRSVWPSAALHGAVNLVLVLTRMA
jgi:membrane protease YdiL (CAAX protease family)